MLFGLFYLNGCFSAMAQPATKTASPVLFRSIFQAAIADGQSDNMGAQIQTVNGLQKNTWFAGIGIGIDYYAGKRSIPFFAAIKKDWRENEKTPFVYADAGYNFSWLRDAKKMGHSGAAQSEKGGLFYELGIGYKFLLKNRTSLGFSAGYSYKQQSEKIVSQQICDFCVPPASIPAEEFDYRLRRVIIKMSCWF